jgi:hypothetical protein
MVDSNFNVKKQTPNRTVPDYLKPNLNSNTRTRPFHITQNNGNENRDTPSHKNQPLFVIYHQNIQGLKGKTNEIMLSLTSCNPNIICLTEHHLLHNEIDTIWLPNYKTSCELHKELIKMWRCMYFY